MRAAIKYLTDAEKVIGLTIPYKDVLINAIITAQKECIEECAEIALAELESYDGFTEATVNKQSILKLIDELK